MGGAKVSSMVAPSTATISVIHNKTFAWAYGGMPYFGYEIFKQETTNAVMAALLINDVINSDTPKDPKNAKKNKIENSIELFRTQSVHGGLWTSPYQVESLGMPSVLIYFLPMVIQALLAIFVVWMCVYAVIVPDSALPGMGLADLPRRFGM